MPRFGSISNTAQKLVGPQGPAGVPGRKGLRGKQGRTILVDSPSSSGGASSQSTTILIKRGTKGKSRIVLTPQIAETAVLIAAPVGWQPGLTGATSGVASRAFAYPIQIPGVMYVKAMVIDISAFGTGVLQWGLFDYRPPNSATQLCGGSRAPTANGWTSIGNANTVTRVEPGNYMLVVAEPAANPSTIFFNPSGTPGTGKFNDAYVWSNTPDLRGSAWANFAASIINAYLEGFMDNGATTWGF